MYFFILLTLQNLVRFLPEQKELNTLSQFRDEYDDLCESEQFGVVVSSFKTDTSEIANTAEQGTQISQYYIDFFYFTMWLYLAALHIVPYSPSRSKGYFSKKLFNFKIGYGSIALYSTC